MILHLLTLQFLLFSLLSSNEVNLSLLNGARATGSSQANGTAFNNVLDGNLTSFWSPLIIESFVSINWIENPQTISSFRIIETPGSEGTIQDWVLANLTGLLVFTSGTGVGEFVNFEQVTVEEVTFVIFSASGIPEILEFEVYENEVNISSNIETYEPSRSPSKSPIKFEDDVLETQSPSSSEVSEQEAEWFFTEAVIGVCRYLIGLRRRKKVKRFVHDLIKKHYLETKVFEVESEGNWLEI
eukprot:snap_masked-scaffold_6-processed-gene-0.36-mRNA-1 protein AED:1.00 eAED:1.00 QI:0/0/0/0/1/1/2/0/241